MTTFMDSYEYQELLSISKAHLDAVDRGRFINGKVIGGDNVNNLRVSTIFACIAVEAALNDYLLIHYLFIENPYVQAFFAETRDRLLRLDMPKKFQIVTKFWSDKFPAQLLADVRRMFGIRNRIVHRTSKLRIAKDAPEGRAHVTNSPLTQDDMAHMLGHHQIASSFLGSFWLPGERELLRWSTQSEQKQDAGHLQDPTSRH